MADAIEYPLLEEGVEIKESIFKSSIGGCRKALTTHD